VRINRRNTVNAHNTYNETHTTKKYLRGFEKC